MLEQMADEAPDVVWGERLLQTSGARLGQKLALTLR
jgi:hypothetical protein